MPIFCCLIICPIVRTSPSPPCTTNRPILNPHNPLLPCFNVPTTIYRSPLVPINVIKRRFSILFICCIYLCGYLLGLAFSYLIIGCTGNKWKEEIQSVVAVIPDIPEGKTTGNQSASGEHLPFEENGGFG